MQRSSLHYGSHRRINNNNRCFTICISSRTPGRYSQRTLMPFNIHRVHRIDSNSMKHIPIACHTGCQCINFFSITTNNKSLCRRFFITPTDQCSLTGSLGCDMRRCLYPLLLTKLIDFRYIILFDKSILSTHDIPVGRNILDTIQEAARPFIHLSG